VRLTPSQVAIAKKTWCAARRVRKTREGGVI
jgi:hypothetical protein